MTTDEHTPTDEAFINYGDLDEQSAARHLSGKSVQQARELLDDNYIRHQEHFMWMGAEAFCFYIDAMLGYVEALALNSNYEDLDDAVGDARMFISICEFRTEDANKRRMVPCAAKVAATLQWLAERLTDLSEPELASRASKVRKEYLTLAREG